MKPSRLEQPLRIPLLYLLFGGLWILLSDQILYLFVFHDAQETIYQMYKGWFFVLTSSILLYILLLSDLAGRKRAEHRALQMKRLYATLAQVNQTIMRVRNQQELFESICKVAVEFGEFRLAWIGLYDKKRERMTPVAERGAGENRLPFQNIKLKDSPFQSGLIGLSAETGLVQFSKDIQTDPRMAHWQEIAARDGYHSAAAVPVRQAGQIIAIVNLYARDIGFFTAPEEQELLEELGLDISFALDVMDKDAERKRAEEEIRSRSRQLTALVKASQSLTESLNLAEVLQRITDQSADILGIETSAIYMADREQLSLSASTPPLPPDVPESFRRVALIDHPHIAQALVSGQLVIISDAASAAWTPAEQAVVDLLGLRTILYIPLAGKKGAQGVLILGTLENPREFSKDEQDLARTLSNQAALAIANAKLYEDLARYVTELENQISERTQAEEKLKRHINYLTGLREVDQAIASSFDVQLSLNILTSRAVLLLNADAASILFLDPVMNVLEYGAGHGFWMKIPARTSIRLNESYAGRAVLERCMVQLPNLSFDASHYLGIGFLKDEKFVSYYGVPLIVKGKVVGVMEVFHRTLVDRDQEWFDFLDSLAGQAAIAIDNARLWDQVQRHARDLELRVGERTAALNRTNAELEHANRAKDEFLANMSHELRTPLNSILGLSESLLEQRRDPLTDYQQRSMEIISSSGHHLLDLINDILDLSKIEAGKFDYYPQNVNVDMLCRSSLSFVKSQAVNKSITINYINNEASALSMSADPRRLKQILVNLLTNAVKFTPERGQLTLQVHADAEQDIMRFSIIDNGIGIAPQDLRCLFQPFVQVDSKLNRQFEGTGLGLALVQKLTDLHGGSIEVESQVGVGSRFTVHLPWTQEKRSPQERTALDVNPPVARVSRESLLPSDEPLGHGVVLLADDNTLNILTVAEYLESHGYKVVKAHDGLEAIEKAEANNPAIILMDIQMPVMDGLEAIRRLRLRSRFAATPIIALTALAMPDDRERCLEAGANDYLSKPVRLKMLLKTIHQLMIQQK